MSTYKFIPCDHVSRVSDGYFKDAADDASAMALAGRAAPGGLDLEVWRGMRFVGLVTTDKYSVPDRGSSFKRLLGLMRNLSPHPNAARMAADMGGGLWLRKRRKSDVEIANYDF